MLGLRRLSLDAIWLEIFPGTGDEQTDQAAIRAFQVQLRIHGLRERYCLLYQPRRSDSHDFDQLHCFGISRTDLLNRLTGPNTLLNLSYSIHPPLLLRFERRILCDLDPSEIFYWMTKIEMGQSTHHEFWTIGLNAGAPDCRLPGTVAATGATAPVGLQAKDVPPQKLEWKTFYPLVDTELIQPQPKPPINKFTTIGQWYWGGAVEVDGEFPDLSKKFAFEKYLEMPAHVPNARFELAMNIRQDDPEHARLAERGWRVVDSHRVART